MVSVFENYFLFSKTRRIRKTGKNVSFSVVFLFLKAQRTQKTLNSDNKKSFQNRNQTSPKIALHMLEEKFKRCRHASSLHHYTLCFTLLKKTVSPQKENDFLAQCESIMKSSELLKKLLQRSKIEDAKIDGFLVCLFNVLMPRQRN